MQEEPEQYAERHPVKGPRGTKLMVILLALVCLFGFALYIAFRHGTDYTVPAEVAQIQPSQERPAMQVAPSSSPSPDQHAYFPRAVQESEEKQKRVASVKSARRTAAATETPETEELTALREYQEAESTKELLSASSNSNASQSSERLERDRDPYAYYDRRNLALRRGVIEKTAQSVAILSYPDVRDLKLTDAVQKPEFEIKIRTANKLKIHGVSIESGEYALKPKLESENWYLMFVGSNLESRPAQLMLTLEAAPYNTDKLFVFVRETGKKVVIAIRLGSEQLTGHFEIE